MEIILTLSICGNAVLAFLVWYFFRLYKRAEFELSAVLTQVRAETRSKLATGIALCAVSILALLFSKNPSDELPS
jgi:hypothetical protein